MVLVQGDTNTVMAGALADSKLHIKVGRVEAGLGSYDHPCPKRPIGLWRIPFLIICLLRPEFPWRTFEGIDEEKIHVIGNTIVDSVYQNLEITKRKVKVLADIAVRRSAGEDVHPGRA